MTDQAMTDTDTEPDENLDVEAAPADASSDEPIDEDVEDHGDADYDDDYDGDFDSLTAAERVLDICLRAIVDDPDEIEIDPVGGGRRLTLHVRVASDDMGKIIGKRGRVANALRTIVKAAGSRDDLSASVEIDD